VRNRTALLALAAFVVLGLPDGMLGPAWPSLRRDLHQPLAALGELTALVSGGFVVSSLLSSRIRDRIGPGAAVAVGATGAGVALAVYAASPLWSGLLLASLVLGFFEGQLDSGFNAHAALHHGPRLMNALHAAYGIGATLGPLVVAVALAAGSWRWAYAAPAVLYAAAAAGLWATRSDLPAALPERWTARSRPQRRRSALPLMLTLFFLIVGVEVAVAAWAPTLLAERGYSRAAASGWVASYWAMYTLSRVALAFVGARVTPAVAARAGGGLTLVGVVLLEWTPAGLPIAGLGVGGLFPALVSLTPVRVGAERAAAAIGYQFAAGTLGATCVVGAAGLVAQFVGIGALVPFLAAAAAALVVLELAASR
jgi:fucose permease